MARVFRESCRTFVVQAGDLEVIRWRAGVIKFAANGTKFRMKAERWNGVSGKDTGGSQWFVRISGSAPDGLYCFWARDSRLDVVDISRGHVIRRMIISER